MYSHDVPAGQRPGEQDGGHEDGECGDGEGREGRIWDRTRAGSILGDAIMGFGGCRQGRRTIVQRTWQRNQCTGNPLTAELAGPGLRQQKTGLRPGSKIPLIVSGFRLSQFTFIFGPHSEVLRVNFWLYTQESVLVGLLTLTLT